jgi:ferritin-like metal-binding protein YciE
MEGRDDMSARQLLASWLRDAHAMETGLVPILENHARDVEANREMAARIKRHAEETRRHAQLVRGCLQRLDSDTSTVKTGLAAVMGTIESVSTAMFGDEILKNALMDYASEHFEIACYRALVEAATAADETEIAATCSEILREEEQMAEWLSTELPRITQSVLARTRV